MFVKQPLLIEEAGETSFGALNFVVERRVNRPSRALARTLRDRAVVVPEAQFGLDDNGSMILDDTLRPQPHPTVRGHDSWRTTGRLLTDRGRLVARVEIEVAESTASSVSVQLRPLRHRPDRWTARRTLRYFSLAHDASDRLVRLLNEFPLVGVHDVPDVTIRPIEVRDTEELRGLFWRMSPESRYFRFLSPVTHPADTCLRRLVAVDHRDRDALVATIDDHVVGVARYDRSTEDPRHAEVAVVVEDAWHRHGVATALLHALGGVATERGVERFTATVAADNRAVTRLVRSFPVLATWNWEAGRRHLDIDLRAKRLAS